MRIANHIFLSKPVAIDLTNDLELQEEADPETEYRKGFYGKGREAWDTNPQPLELRQITALTTRQSAQAQCLPDAHRIPLHVPLGTDDVQPRCFSGLLFMFG